MHTINHQGSPKNDADTGIEKHIFLQKNSASVLLISSYLNRDENESMKMEIIVKEVRKKLIENNERTRSENRF